MDYRKIITIEPGKRGGRPCVRGLRITVGDVLGWVAAGMSTSEIVDDYPDLTEKDIRACLAYAADRERRSLIAVGSLAEHAAKRRNREAAKRANPNRDAAARESDAANAVH
jgi:uncharacterized protein (DUF433 family)